jgi:hypothetical protein
MSKKVKPAKAEKPAKKVKKLKVGSLGGVFKGTIRMKIALAIGATVLAVTVALGIFAAWSIRQSTYDALGKNMLSSAGIAANVVSGELNARVAELQNISDEVNTIASKDLKRVKIEILQDDYDLQFLGMADETGLLAGKGETTNVAEEDFFKACRDTLKPFIGDVKVSDDKKMATITVAVPYIENDTF